MKKEWKKINDGEKLSEAELDRLMEEEEGEASVKPKHNDSALEHPSYQHLEEKLTIAEQQAHENWEKAVRAAAELENVRRRAERDVANAHRYSLEKFASALLPVLDSLEQALQMATNADNQAMHEGLELTMKLFLDVLAKSEVTAIDPINQLFDPQQHEAMSMQEVTDVAPNTVIAVFQKGYKLHDRIIRPARVVVAK